MRSLFAYTGLCYRSTFTHVGLSHRSLFKSPVSKYRKIPLSRAYSTRSPLTDIGSHTFLTSAKNTYISYIRSHTFVYIYMSYISHTCLSSHIPFSHALRTHTCLSSHRPFLHPLIFLSYIYMSFISQTFLTSAHIHPRMYVEKRPTKEP